MVSNGIKYLFIGSDFDEMMKLKETLEQSHSTLQCDVLLNYNPRIDLAQYCLLAADVFSISAHPLELLATLRHATYIPIAVLVPQAQMDAEESQDHLFSQLYELGADMILPLHLPDTMAGYFGAYYRRHVYFQHQEPVRHRSTMIFRDELVIEPKRRSVTVQGREVKLTFKEFDLLNYLACNADIVITYDMIAERIWGLGEIVNSTIFSAIKRLRQKIEPNMSKPTYIQTVYGIGYTFKSYIVESSRDLRYLQ